MKKFLSLLLVGIMLMCMIPMTAFAANTTVSTSAELTNALSAANAGDTIQLTADITVGLDTTYTVSKEITLDLNGHTLLSEGTVTASNSWYSFIHIVKGGNLTVTDTSAEKDGSIETHLTYSDDNWSGQVTVWVEGELTLDAGTIQMVVDGTGSGLPFAIDVRPNQWSDDGDYTTKFTMNGGKVSINGTEDAIRLAVNSSASYTDAKVECTINGGEISGGNSCIFMQQLNTTYRHIKLTINGGELTGTSSVVRTYVPEVDPSTITYVGPTGTSAYDITINGGKLVATDPSSTRGVVNFSDEYIPESMKKVAVTGGSLSGGNTAKLQALLAKYAAITHFTLTKNFVIKTGYDGAGDPVTDPASKFTANPTFTIASLSSFNRQVGKTAIPDFSPASYTVNVSGGEDSVDITLPDYTSAGVGDYWYTVTEQAIDTIAGVAIDTTSTRYLHVQVVWDDTDPAFTTLKVASVTLHNTEPNATTGAYTNDTSDKTDRFTNTYGAGSLKITKALSGNMADPDKVFAVSVTFTAPTGKTVMSDISYSGGFTDATGTAPCIDAKIDKGWSTTQTVTVYLKKDSTVTFSNIPDGVTYAIAETDYSADGYTTAYAVDSTGEEATKDTATSTGVTGSISDSLDSVTITNTKTVAIDVGVILNNAPFVVLLVGSIAFLAVYFVTKRRKEEEN